MTKEYKKGMPDKYIIYTMGIPEINEAVQKVLFEKGYKLENSYSGGDNAEFIILNGNGYAEDTPGVCVWGDYKEWPNSNSGKKFKELTFRELCELPPVHDELDSIADRLVVKFNQYWYKENGHCKYSSLEDFPFCDLWERMKPKLGL